MLQTKNAYKIYGKKEKLISRLIALAKEEKAKNNRGNLEKSVQENKKYQLEEEVLIFKFYEETKHSKLT